MNIRKATPEDNHLLSELGARTYRDTFAADNTEEDMALYLARSFSSARQAAELAQAGTFFLIAEEDGQPVGYARLRQDPPPECIKGTKTIEIVRLYAVKERIGRGIGAALMQACLDEAVRLGCDMIWLDVWEKNPRAITFYQKWGFEKVGEQGFQMGTDLQHDWLMARPVAG